MSQHSRFLRFHWVGFAFVLVLLLTNPCYARLTLGWVNGSGSPVDNEQEAKTLTGLLGQVLGEDVREHGFDSESVLHDWLNRYREVDIAFFSRDYLKSQSSVEFYGVADYYLADEDGLPAPFRVVARKWLPASRLRQIQQAFIALDTLPAAQKFLQEHDLHGFVLPDQEPPAAFLVPFEKPHPPVQKAPAPAPAAKSVKKVKAEAPAPPVQEGAKPPAVPEEKAAPEPPVAPIVSKTSPAAESAQTRTEKSPQKTAPVEMERSTPDVKPELAPALPESPTSETETPVAEQSQGKIEWGWPEFLFAGLLLLLVLGGLWQYRQRRKERLLQEWLPDLGKDGQSPASSAGNLPATDSVKEAFEEALAAAPVEVPSNEEPTEKAEEQVLGQGSIPEDETASDSPGDVEKPLVAEAPSPPAQDQEAVPAEETDDVLPEEQGAPSVEDEEQVPAIHSESATESMESDQELADFDKEFSTVAGEPDSDEFIEASKDTAADATAVTNETAAEPVAKPAKRRRKKRKAVEQELEPPPMPRQPAMPAETAADVTEAAQDDVANGNADVSAPFQLQGDLGAARVLEVLQMLANYVEPVTLVIRNPLYEKRLHFRHGHVVQVSSLNLVKKSKANFLMNKLGYILVRERKISEEQRDQALDLCEANPQLRIGEALVQLGALTKNELLDALRRQAEGVVFSLFLFPEGEYELIPEKLDIAEEDDLLMPVTGLLQEAAQNASEWDRIRTAIPSLNTVLDFSPSGREKSDNARLTVHQKMILALVDGKRTVQDICVEATMLDFEVYRFLYLMLYAKILRRVN